LAGPLEKRVQSTVCKPIFIQYYRAHIQKDLYMNQQRIPAPLLVMLDSGVSSDVYKLNMSKKIVNRAIYDNS